MDFLAFLSPAAAQGLHALPFRDGDRANRLLNRLGERAGGPQEALPFLETVLSALPEAPDPEMALLNLERWSAHLVTPASTVALLLANPRLLADLLCLFGTSQYLADILVRDPSLYTLFLEPDSPRSREGYGRAVETALRALRRPESRRDALRRVKRREFLRTGWRDLCRRAPFAEVVGEISDLADALVNGALQLACEAVHPQFPSASRQVQFAVIAMGKLGARELNYSSDIDLVFVMDSPTPQDEGQRRYATRLAEKLIALLAEDTTEGRCFRVDMRLRPEGRSGALVRSYAAFREYYDRWAETWERQALIKARPVAGDAELGARFLALTRPVVYRRLQGATVVVDVQEMRAAVERKLEAAGELDRQVKEGRGSIRDVEFSVQLLQLLFGAERPALQAPDTATALARLEEAGILTSAERNLFADGYRFFREVEHRLQILHDRAVRIVPSDPVDLRRIALSMGYPDAGRFVEAYDGHRREVRALAQEIFTRLGATGPGAADALRASVLQADTPEGAADLRRVLEAREFPALDAALKALVRLAAGGPHFPHPGSTRRVFADVAGQLVDGCAAAADPTWALEGLADLADRKLLHRALYQTWQEHPDALDALARFAGAAPAAMRVVLRYPELADVVADEEQLTRRRTPSELRDELAERLAHASTYDRRLTVLRRFKLREFVRLAARRILAPTPVDVETCEWSELAEVLVREALDTALERLRCEGRWPRADAAEFTVFSLGRFSGHELHFASDLDLLYVRGADAEITQQQYELLGRSLTEALQTVTEEGRLFEADLRLRPEGRQGFTVATLEGARRYYGDGGRAETWELQMLTRLRPIAGNAAVAEAFRALIEPRVYRAPMPATWREEIRAMKRRIETERVSERERPWNLKLGAGGFSDIEFLVQYLQLEGGGADPSLRQTSTVGVIRALEAAGRLSAEAAAVLLAAHGFLTGLRQALYLLGPNGGDCLPLGETDSRLNVALARALGYGDPEELQRAYQAHTGPVRELFLEELGGAST